MNGQTQHVVGAYIYISTCVCVFFIYLRLRTACGIIRTVKNEFYIRILHLLCMYVQFTYMVYTDIRKGTHAHTQIHINKINIFICACASYTSKC